MTLDEAIGHVENVAEDLHTFCPCRNEYRQLADWLKELRELKTGKKAGTWLNGDDFEYEFAECSNCGRPQYAGWNSHAEAETMIGSFHANYRFCPGCGAEMTGGEYVRRRKRRCAK